MKRELRMELRIGLLLFGLTLVLKQFFQMPEAVMGLLLGLALCFELIGALPETSYRKVKDWKRSLFARR
ncbi:hypothetical protein [Anaerolentibacter hominis]|uniref:hypothetical protein n=1 Tax=Anaerolentibacter hominis TaxID=3079009 RepID=UPI0031B80CB6